MSDSDIVRVIRILLYEGHRDWVEYTVGQSIHGEKVIAGPNKIKAATLGEFPEILHREANIEDTKN